MKKLISFRDITGIHRVFVVQLGLVVVTTLLVFVGYGFEAWRGADRSFGFFWFAFLAGCFGSSIALLRRVRAEPETLPEVTRTWTDLLLPHLYGGLMAGLAYMLFLSGILSGTGKGGLLTSNLFPDFTTSETSVRPSITAYLNLRPASITDAGRLLVWSFIAGYSERFVTGILDQMGTRGAAKDRAEEVREGPRLEGTARHAKEEKQSA